jgi:hypothetical protein
MGKGINMNLQKAIDLLGFKAKDVITNFEGVITSVSFDLYGCIQVILKPQKVKEDGTTSHGEWFDINRLKITSKKPIMDILDFTQKYPSLSRVQGPEAKPIK